MVHAVIKVGPTPARRKWTALYGQRNTPALSTFTYNYGKFMTKTSMENQVYRSKVVHIYDVERGWSGANEHYTQLNTNIDYRIYL
jgi:hypothetical protein